MKRKVRIMLAFESISLIYYCFSDGKVEPLTAIISAVIWLALIIYALIIERMKGWLNAVLFSFCTSLVIQIAETTKYFRLKIVLNIQNAIRIPFFITTFVLPIGGSV